jgi:hypothetical protein
MKPSVTAHGVHFRAREYVRVTLKLDTVTRSRVVRASRVGTFNANLGALPSDFDPCSDGGLILARGRTGDAAMIKIVPRQCPPRL